jgi:HAD superfamily hydrolase (TIGR01490 family)
LPTAAFFDVDGTLTKTTILDPLIWYQRARLSWPRFALWAAGLLLQVPRYLVLDWRSRRRFIAAFYRRYAGLNAAALREWHRQTFADNLRPRLFPGAVECIREHQQHGQRIVLVTGGLEFVMRPLAEYLRVDELMASRLADHDGVFTGELNGPPSANERKVELVREYAQRHDIDLAQSFAYGNSLDDAPMLAEVGQAVAVNPDRRLRARAAERGWRVVQWAMK